MAPEQSQPITGREEYTINKKRKEIPMTLPNLVSADVDSIQDLSGVFDTLKTDIEKATTKLDQIKIAAGDFTDADNLETTVTTRIGDLKTNLGGLSKALGIISENLGTIATKYTSTENQNKLTAKDLDDMINDLETALPGFDD
jgi:hypothetical protein